MMSLSMRAPNHNITFILDMIDYNHLILDESFDFYKAFDTTEHSFMFKVTEFIGFSDHFF